MILVRPPLDRMLVAAKCQLHLVLALAFVLIEFVIALLPRLLVAAEFQLYHLARLLLAMVNMVDDMASRGKLCHANADQGTDIVVQTMAAIRADSRPTVDTLNSLSIAILATGSDIYKYFYGMVAAVCDRACTPPLLGQRRHLMTWAAHPFLFEHGSQSPQ